MQTLAGPFVRIECGGTSVRLERKDGILYVQDLFGSGEPGDLMNLIAQIYALGIEEDVYFPLGEGLLYEKLREIAKKMGATKYIEVWRLKKHGN